MRLAHVDVLPPFAEVRHGRSTGIVVDIVRAAAERSGLPIELLPVPFEQTEPALADGRADAAIPIAITPERQQRLDFSAPLLMTGGALFVRAPHPSPAGLLELSGQRVVTPRTGPLVAFIRSKAPQVRLEVTEDYESSLAKLIGSEADAAALNIQAGAMLAKRLHPGRVTLPSAMFLELPFGAAVLKGRNGGLLERLNAGLEAIRADGTWARLATTEVEA